MARGKGEGSIYRRGDGYWVGSVEAGRDEHGRRKKARVVRRYRADVVTALDELRRHVAQGVVPDRSRSVEQYLTWWLDEVAANQVSAGSLHEYGTRVKRITPEIGHHKLANLRTPHVQALANRLARTYPRSPKTRATTLATLRQALRWAVGAELIVRNPAEGVTGPKTPVAKVDDTMEADEAKAVLKAAEGDALEAMYWLAVNYGLRIGELMALRWPDVDFAEGEITVRRSATKSDAGHRTLPLIDDAKRVLQAHRRKQPVTQIDGYVFCRATGQRLYHALVHRRWNDLLTKAGITHLCRNCDSSDKCSSSVRRFHSSRHTCATLLLERGVELEVVSAILGHANISLTANIYAKVRSDLRRRGLVSLHDG
jgi:integrase